MEQSQLNWMANFIWGIADDVLRDLYVRGKYRDVVLPMTVLRRLDAVLEPTKQGVLDTKALLDSVGVVQQDQALRQAAGQAFYNTSKFTLRDLRARASQQQLKPAHRQGKEQLIDVTQWFKPLRKNLGKKNCELSEADIRKICDTFLAFEETEQSKLFPNAAFGYWKVTVERPLRLRAELGQAARAAFREACAEAGEEALAKLIDTTASQLGPGPHTDFNAFLDALNAVADTAGAKLNAKRLKLIREGLTERDEAAAPVRKKVHKPGKAEADPLRGLFETTVDGKRCVVECEPDSDLRDTEQVPLMEPGGIEAFIRREVLPHAPDAWIDESGIKTGYEISFTRYFYKPQPLRSLEEIRADILALQKETEGLLEEIIGAGNGRADGMENGASTARRAHKIGSSAP